MQRTKSNSSESYLHTLPSCSVIHEHVLYMYMYMYYTCTYVYIQHVSVSKGVCIPC